MQALGVNGAREICAHGCSDDLDQGRSTTYDCDLSVIIDSTGHLQTCAGDKLGRWALK